MLACFQKNEGQVIDDESGNTDKDPGVAEEAVSQGEGRIRLPVLLALRQDLPGGHSTARLRVGESQRDIVDADLSKYFYTIPHSELLKSVARRIVDRDVLHLIKMWLKAPVEERDENGSRRMTGGKGSKPTAGESLQEPVSEVLADHRTGKKLASRSCQLR